MLLNNQHRRALILLTATLILLSLIYLPTLLTEVTGGVEINGVQDPYMQDVGEIQVALNIWGTLHHTGYPLYTILGNMGSLALRAMGIDAATAPVLYSMTWGLIALTAFYALVYHLTNRPEIAAATTLLLGLARSIWIHNVIANVRSMGFAFEAILLAVALWSAVTTADESRRKIWLLALIGGFGVAHHRSVAFMAPGLLLAMWPGLRAQGRRAWITLAVAVPISLIGFLPYLYLPARAWAHADWVYGNPGTLPGFWHEFTGAEAAFLMHTPVDAQAWINDFVDTFRILWTDLTPVFAIAGGIALLWAMVWSRFRRETRIAFVCTLGYFAYLFAYHYVVIPQAIAMPIVMVLVLGLAFALDGLISQPAFLRTLGRFLTLGDPLSLLNRSLWVYAITGIFAVIVLVLLVPAQFGFIFGLTHNDTGLAMIDLAKQVPRDSGKSVMMMPWGPRHTAIAFSKYVTKVNADLNLITHNADISGMAAQGDVFYTSKDTFYAFPLSWWDGQLGHAYLSAQGDGLVAIRREPVTAQDTQGQPVGHGIIMRGVSLCASGDKLLLTITWQAESKPDTDLSVFAKVMKADVVVAQADNSAPVYGWYPTSRWSAGEVVEDNYTLPLQPGALARELIVGMYQQQPSGEFQNYGTQTLPLVAISACGNP